MNAVRRSARKPRAAALLRLLPLAPVIAIALLAPAPSEPQVRATAATGNVKLANSRGGGAIVSAMGMDPGDQVTGTVAISNSGDARAALSLSKSQLQDSPGIGGGRLSKALYLSVDDLSVGRRVYEGPLAAMPRFPLAPIPARGRHTFRFTVKLPRTRGDAYQIASTSVRFDWSATAMAKPPVRRDTQPPRLTLSGKRVQRATRRGLVLFALCDEPCRISARARVYGVRGVRHGHVRPAVSSAAAIRRVGLRVTFKRRALKRLRRAGRHARVRVTVAARDTAGNRTVRRRKIRLRGPRRPPVPLSVMGGRYARE